MAVKEKKIVQAVVVCDLCHNDIEANHATHLEGSVSGYMVRERLRIDLCVDCAGTFGLRRRGRRPNTDEAVPLAAHPRRTRQRALAADPDALIPATAEAVG